MKDNRIKYQSSIATQIWVSTSVTATTTP